MYEVNFKMSGVILRNHILVCNRRGAPSPRQPCFLLYEGTIRVLKCISLWRTSQHPRQAFLLTITRDCELELKKRWRDDCVMPPRYIGAQLAKEIKFFAFLFFSFIFLLIFDCTMLLLVNNRQSV